MVDKAKAVALTINKVSKTFDSSLVLDNVSFSLDRGSITVLVGTNGSGKTTLIKSIAGVVSPDTGSIDIIGAQVGTRQARAVTSVVFDDPSLYPDLTVYEHLGFSARLAGSGEFDDRVNELLEKFGILELKDRIPKGFSRGQRQKTALSIGLVRPFRLLVLDEPYVGLDTTGKNALIFFIRQARDAGVCVLVATHSVELLEVADKMIVLSYGKLKYQGKPDTSKLDIAL